MSKLNILIYNYRKKFKIKQVLNLKKKIKNRLLKNKAKVQIKLHKIIIYNKINLT